VLKSSPQLQLGAALAHNLVILSQPAAGRRSEGSQPLLCPAFRLSGAAPFQAERPFLVFLFWL
jgi:hypothetical protein